MKKVCVASGAFVRVGVLRFVFRSLLPLLLHKKMFIVPSQNSVAVLRHIFSSPLTKCGVSVDGIDQWTRAHFPISTPLAELSCCATFFPPSGKVCGNFYPAVGGEEVRWVLQ